MPLHRLTFESAALRQNPLGDSSTRPLLVYTPEGYDHADARYPVLFLLHSHGNSAESFLNWRPWSENMLSRLDRLIGKEVPPAIVVMPDTWTRLGGSQYLNSVMGRYEDYLIDEILPYIEANFRTNGRRAVLGHSSGGYGALVLAMRHPNTFHALACHAGDMYWEYSCMSGIAALHQNLARFGGAEAFIEAIPSHPNKNSAFWMTLMTLCYTLAHTPPAESLTFDLPILPDTGALNEVVWERWLQFDPLRMVDQPDCLAALGGLALVYLTAGLYDEYQLQVGARLLRDKLLLAEIPVLHEEFPASHSGSEVPYDRSISLLVAALT